MTTQPIRWNTREGVVRELVRMLPTMSSPGHALNVIQALIRTEEPNDLALVVELIVNESLPLDTRLRLLMALSHRGVRLDSGMSRRIVEAIPNAKLNLHVRIELLDESQAFIGLDDYIDQIETFDMFFGASHLAGTVRARMLARIIERRPQDAQPWWLPNGFRAVAMREGPLEEGFVERAIETSRAEFLERLAEFPDRRRELVQRLLLPLDLLIVEWGGPQKFFAELAKRVERAIDAATTREAWDALGARRTEWFSQRKEQQEGIRGTIIARVRGGFRVDIAGVRCFLPASLACGDGKRPDDLVGVEDVFVVERTHPVRAHVVVGRAARDFAGRVVAPEWRHDHTMRPDIADNNALCRLLATSFAPALRQRALRTSWGDDVFHRWVHVDEHAATSWAATAGQWELRDSVLEHALSVPRDDPRRRRTFDDDVRTALDKRKPASLRSAALRAVDALYADGGAACCDEEVRSIANSTTDECRITALGALARREEWARRHLLEIACADRHRHFRSQPRAIAALARIAPTDDDVRRMLRSKLARELRGSSTLATIAVAFSTEPVDVDGLTLLVQQALDGDYMAYDALFSVK